MLEPELIERRQYAEMVLKGLNIRPFRVDISSGVVFVPKNKLATVKKLCKHFNWPVNVKVFK
jgi:hypothetical protein